jgi:hypothetical protein
MYAGDGARRDSDGFYWITGRVDDIINVCCVTVSQNGVATLFGCLLCQFVPAVMVKGGNDSSESLHKHANLRANIAPSEPCEAAGRALRPSFLLSNVLFCLALICTALNCPALICTALHCTGLRCAAQVSGHRISTSEVESALDAHHACVEAAVVGYEHPVKAWHAVVAWSGVA